MDHPTYGSRDRRRTYRRPTMDNVALLDSSESVGTPSSSGTLLDVSESGALLACRPLPTLNQRLFLRLEKPLATDWSIVRVVRQAGTGLVGVRFISSSPLEIMLAATRGTDLDETLAALVGGERYHENEEW